VTSTFKKDANRRNAKASTGPKSEHGKIRSARNSLRHGLATPLSLDPAWAEKAKRLARELAGTEADPVLCDSAQELAQAYADVQRARQAQHSVVSHALSDRSFRSAKEDKFRQEVVIRILELSPEWRERRPNGKLKPRRRGVRTRGLSELALIDLIRGFDTELDEAEKYAVLISEMAQKMNALHRYERRAFSRFQRLLRAYNAITPSSH
jgi:hypothetical protein